MPDDHSKLVPLLPISNRTVKRLSADDSADSRVKVGHRQASTAQNAPPIGGAFSLEDIQILLKKAQKRDTMEGFADRGEASKVALSCLGSLKIYSR